MMIIKWYCEDWGVSQNHGAALSREIVKVHSINWSFFPSQFCCFGAFYNTISKSVLLIINNLKEDNIFNIYTMLTKALTLYWESLKIDDFGVLLL